MGETKCCELHLRRGLVLAAIVGLIFAVTGCGSSSSSSTSGGGGGGRESGSGFTEGQASASLPPAKGDISNLTWALPTGEPNTLTPAKAEGGSQFVVSNMCDGIAMLNPDFSPSDHLATYTTPDEKTLVFNVRKGVKFWDGHPLTAKDVAYSLNYAANPKTSSWFWVFENTSSITQTGPYQVTVKFKTPDALFPKEMATPAGMVMEAEFAEKAGKALGTPGVGVMCSGPFEFKKWNPGSNIELVRNDNYWDPAWKAHAENLKIEFTASTTALSSGLQSGTFDGSYTIAPPLASTLESASSGQLSFGEGGFLVIQPARPTGPMGDPKLRQALSIAIDREGISEAAYLGRAEPNYSTLPKRYWAWNPETKALWQKQYDKFEQEFAYNTQKAKKLVEETNYAGEPIKLAIQAGEETQAIVAQLIQQNAKEAGLNVKIEALQPIPKAEADQGNKALLAHLDLLLVENYIGVPDPVETIGYFGPEPFYNFAGYKNAEVAKLYTEAVGEFNEKKKAELLIKAQEIFNPPQSVFTILGTPEILFLKNGLTGATKTLAYLDEPSLAKVGASE